MKKVLVLFVGLMVLQGAFASGTQEQGAAQGPTEVTFWHNYSAGAETDYMADVIIPRFEEQNPDVKIKVVAQGGDQYNNLIITALGTGATPDLARVDLTDLANYAQLGGTIALEDMEGFQAVADSLFPGPLSTNYYQGHYFGLPLGTNAKVAVVNMDAMERLGFSEPPKTMEEFIEASKQHSPDTPTINVSSVGEWDILPYFWLFGGVLTDEEFTTATGYFDSDASVEAVQKILDLYQSGVLAIKELDGSVDAWDGIQSGKYAMIFEGPWFFTFISDYADKNIVPALIPTYRGKTTSVVGGENVAMFVNTEDPEATFRFIRFLVSRETQIMMAENMGQMPVNMDAAADPRVMEDPIWSVYLEQLQTAKARIPSPRKQLIQQHIKDTFMRIFAEDAPVRATLQDGAQLIDQELNQ